MYASRVVAEKALRQFGDSECCWHDWAAQAIEAIRLNDAKSVQEIAQLALANDPCDGWRDWIMQALDMDFGRTNDD